MVDYLGAVRDGTLDYNSPFFVSSGAIGAFIVTDDGSTIRVYKCTDIQAIGELDWTLVSGGSFTPGAGWNGKVRIFSSREEADFLLVTWKDQTGVKVARSTTGTPSFGAAAAVGSVITDTDHDDDEHGAWVFDEMQVIIAPDGTVGDDGKYQYFPHVATTKTGSFAPPGSIPTDFSAVLGCVCAKSATIFVVPMVNPIPPSITPLSTVTFDGSGYSSYTITGAGTTTIGATPPAAYNALNLAGAGLSNGLIVEVDFVVDYILTGMTWVAAQSGGVLTNAVYTTRIDFYDAEATLLKTITDTSVTSFLMALTAKDIGLEQAVRKVKLTTTLSWDSDTGVGINDVYVDNIAFDAEVIEQTQEFRLYKVELPSTWTDITPSEVVVPSTPYGIAIDNADSNLFTMLAKDEKGYMRLLTSSTAGSSWSTRKRNVRYTGIKRGGNTLIAFGFNCIDLSPDLGLTFYPRIGNWVAAIGSVDEIRWMAGVL